MRNEDRASLDLYRRLRSGGGDELPALWARAFARLLDRHRREDGRPWAYAALERATGGVVTQTWASNLANGRIAEPGFAKLWAVTLVLGASFGEWLEELDPGDDAGTSSDTP